MQPDAPFVCPYVRPKKITRDQFLVDCPHCGQEHCHGIGWGHRSAHCASPKPETAYQGYVIIPERMFGL